MTSRLEAENFIHFRVGGKHCVTQPIMAFVIIDIKLIVAVYLGYGENYSNEERLNKLAIYFASRLDAAFTAEIYEKSFPE